MRDLARLDHREQRVEHPVLGRDPVPEQVHPAPQRRARAELGDQLAGAGGEPRDLVLVDRVDQRLPGGEMPVEGGDADPGLGGDRAHRRLGLGGGEQAGRHGQQLFAVAGRVRPRSAGLGVSQSGSRSVCARLESPKRSIVRLWRQETNEHDRTDEPSSPVHVVRRAGNAERPGGAHPAGGPGTDPRPGHRGRPQPDGLVHDLRRGDRRPLRPEPAVRIRHRLRGSRGPGRCGRERIHGR